MYNELMMDAAKLNYTKAKEDLYAKVKLAYFEYLTLKVEYLALSKAFDKIETLFEKTRVEYKAKAISELDLAESQNFRTK
jgi:outer membrane protein TolC